MNFPSSSSTCLTIPLVAANSVGVLEDKSSSSKILEDNFEVLGLGLGLES